MTSFYRLSGGGNDFLALVEPASQPTTEEISAWCRRGVAAGADGLFVLQRTDSGITMRHFNADGHSANFCLNGTRCAVQLAKHLEWVDDEIEVLTGAGPVRGRTQGSSDVSLALTSPTKPQLLDLETSEGNHSGWFAAGEMIDWDAPTGGYLLQGCFSTAVAAANGIENWLETQA